MVFFKLPFILYSRLSLNGIFRAAGRDTSAMSESAKPKGAGGSAKGASHSSLTVAEWRTLLAEFFTSPWSGQQAESFVSAKNQERKAANLKRKQGDQLTLITMQTFKNKASKEKKTAAGEGREPGQFQALAPVAPEAKRIKTTEWAEIEKKVPVIELFDFLQTISRRARSACRGVM